VHKFPKKDDLILKQKNLTTKSSRTEPSNWQQSKQPSNQASKQASRQALL